MYPDVLELKEVAFEIDTTTCSMCLAKFANRFSVLSDEFADINFNSEGDDDQYAMTLRSQHMMSRVSNRKFEAAMREDDLTDKKSEYTATLSRQKFLKFFSILKQPGFATLKINHNNKLEMVYNWDGSASNITVIQEVIARSF